jgi:hypothetical protein
MSGELKSEMEKIKERAALALKREKKRCHLYKEKCIELHKKVGRSRAARHAKDTAVRAIHYQLQRLKVYDPCVAAGEGETGDPGPLGDRQRRPGGIAPGVPESAAKDPGAGASPTCHVV